MASTLLLDTVLRLLAIGQLLLVGLVLGRSLAPRSMRLAIVMLLASVAAYLLNASPFLQARLGPFRLPTLFAAQFVPLLLWLVAHLLFERSAPRWPAWVVTMIVALCVLSFVLGDIGSPFAVYWAAVTQHAVSLALLAHALTFAICGRGDDLVEKRRRFRVGFVLVVGMLALAVVVVETLHGFAPAAPPFLVVQSAMTLIASLGFGAVMLASDADLLFNTARRLPATELSPSEHVLNRKLEALMADAVYREPGLSIRTLAARLDVPEHRLRSLINKRLGYRNFPDFLNRHRIAEAKRTLSDPERVDLPVLTIAMDLGYGSLAPFNRAFREATGQTPSDYRRRTILQP